MATLLACLLLIELCYMLGTSTPARATTALVATSPASSTHRLYLPLVTKSPLPGTDARPAWSTPIATSLLDGTIWVANPDSGSISVIDPTTLTLLTEIPVGGEPWSLALAPDGRRVFVVDRAGGQFVVVDVATATVSAHVRVGPEPGGVVLSPSGTKAYIALSTANEVVQVDTSTLAIRSRIGVRGWPFALAMTDDGDGQDDDERVYVTHLLAFPRAGFAEAADDGRTGGITIIDTATNQIAKEVVLRPDAHGFPNLLSGIALGAGHAWVPHVRAAPALPNGLTTTVFAAIDALDLATSEEHTAARLNLNDETIFGSPVNNPVAAIPALDGTTLYVILAGSDLIEVIDIMQPEQPRLLKFLPVGRNPRGMALSADGRQGYVMSYLSRSVTVLDLERLEAIAHVPVTGETLDPQVLRGKILFNNAVSPQMARVAWISCASCHADGGADGVTWMFPDGPRQTPPLWNSGRTLPWHWSAALDEPQDIEDTIQIIQHGLGLAPGADPPLLSTPNAGRSADLDALAALLEHGLRVPEVPTPVADTEAGRPLFVTAGCVGCHAGPEWTTSARSGPAGTLDLDGNGMVDDQLRNVGTYNPQDVRGRTGFDVPSLLGVGLTAPYFHDGSAPTLAALVASGHPRPQSGPSTLTKEEIDALVTFMTTIGPATPSFERR